MSLLESIREPADLRRLSRAELDGLAREIRDFLVTEVTRTGGHLGPNLGVVELTLALHRVFDSPRDRIVWDTGHQAYVHKIVTGRAAGFAQLRQAGGLSGYPSRAESEHDVIESSHASTALSWADGLAKAYQLTGEDRRGGRRGRRRRAHRRDVLGGAEQHRRGQGPAGGHRRQRQHPLVRADHRRAGRPPGHAAHQQGVRAASWSGASRRQGAPRSSATPSTARCTGRRRA